MFKPALALVVLLSACSQKQDLAGGSSDVENDIAGNLLTGALEPAVGARVFLRPWDYDPVSRLSLSGLRPMETQSGPDGSVRFEGVDPGEYHVEGVSPLGLHMLRRGVWVESEKTLDMGKDTLQAHGRIVLILPDSLLRAGAYAYVPGTSAGAQVDSHALQSRRLIIDSVPASRYPAIYGKDGAGRGTPVYEGFPIQVTAGGER